MLINLNKLPVGSGAVMRSKDVVQFVPQEQPLLFEFWSNEFSDNLTLTAGNIFKQIQEIMDHKTTVNELTFLAKLNSVGSRERSAYLFSQIQPNSQILMRYPG